MSTQDEDVVFPCLEVTQPLGTFYTGVVDANDIVSISKADVRRIVDRDIEVLSGIQRPLSPRRVEELQRYVRTVDATFPTSIILAVSSELATFNGERRVMTIQRREDAAKIIDGQHRIAGLKEIGRGLFALNVVVFVEMEPEDQAMVFATINLTQTKVNKSLAYDLYDFAKARSPQKTCHNIARLLNREADSPLHGMIKILGVASGRPTETITQATFVERLMPYVSADPLSDKDTLKRGRRLKEVVGNERESRVFRNMFIRGDDASIAKSVWNYFAGVADRWPTAWKEVRRGNILNRASGFAALMRLLGDCYRKAGHWDEVLTKEEVGKVLRRIRIADDEFTPERFKPGTGGEAELYRTMLDHAQMG
jgi:DGQHR domain